MTLGRPWLVVHIVPPRKRKILPVVLSLEEVRSLEPIANIKHRVMMLLAFAGGLRLSEVAALHTTDIGIHVHSGIEELTRAVGRIAR